MSRRSLFDTVAEMRHCVVYERIGQCHTFELTLEADGSFIVACVMDKTGNGSFIFTTFQDCHLRAYQDIVRLMQDNTDYVGKMSRDWISGLSFALLNPFDQVICEIRFLSSIFERLPISFKMKVYPGLEDEPPPPAATAPPKQSLFNLTCFDGACMESTEDEGEKRAAAHAGSAYTTLESSLDSDTLYLQTRKPAWNREIKHWVHNFGGRVRLPSNKNFLVVQSTAAEHYNAGAHVYGSTPHNVEAAADLQTTDRVCIRHGKRTSNSYILDFRAPASLMVAFAAMCATHAAKPLVNA